MDAALAGRTQQRRLQDLLVRPDQPLLFELELPTRKRSRDLGRLLAGNRREQVAEPLDQSTSVP
jgi:hypothetical protein